MNLATPDRRGASMGVMKNIRIIRAAAAALFAMVLTACFETKQDFTLNPDGSGKVVHECRFQPFSMNFGADGAEPTEEEKLKKAVADLISKSEGVDAWDNVHYEQLDDGRILFRGTAWFPDIAKLKIENQTMMAFQWNRDPSGNGELSMNIEKGDDDDDEAEAPNTPPADEEGRKKWLAAERGKFQQARMMMVTMLAGMKHNATFRLPGGAGETRNFEKADDGALSIAFQGEKFLTAMDALMADDEWLLANGAGGEQGPEFDGIFAEKIFGQPGMPIAKRTALGDPLFDYQAEVAAARANAPALQEKLGSAAVAALPPSEGGPLKSARVVGIRLSNAVDSALELRPFNDEPGLGLSILCEFDGAVFEIDDKSTVETATTDTGASILPKSEFRRQINFPRLSPNKTHTLFDISLSTPPAGATRLRDLAGTLQYTTAGATKEIDVGIAKIEKGARGEELGAEITEIEPGWKEDGPLDLSLRLNISHNLLQKAYLVTGDTRTELESRGYSGSNDTTTFTLELPKKYNPDSRIVVEVYDGLRNFTAPFILRDIPLPILPAD
jgi:hypothetical protein